MKAPICEACGHIGPWRVVDTRQSRSKALLDILPGPGEVDSKAQSFECEHAAVTPQYAFRAGAEWVCQWVQDQMSND